MISKDEVQHIATLARLELTENDPKGSPEKMQKDLSVILDYFELLKKAPKPAKDQHPIPNTQHLRKDEVISSHDLADELIAAAPDKKDDYIKVKAIL